MNVPIEENAPLEKRVDLYRVEITPEMIVSGRG